MKILCFVASKYHTFYIFFQTFDIEDDESESEKYNKWLLLYSIWLWVEGPRITKICSIVIVLPSECNKNMISEVAVKRFCRVFEITTNWHQSLTSTSMVYA